jgi:hypothetical protein
VAYVSQLSATVKIIILENLNHDSNNEDEYALTIA